jgi:hypothetical protein
MQTVQDQEPDSLLTAPPATTIESADQSKSIAIPLDSHALPSSAWQSLAGWLVIALLLLIQLGLFRQFAQREITWAYPTNHDQVTYLSLSYETYEGILTQGLLPGIWVGLKAPIPNGIMIHVQAALLFLVIGASRLSALTLSFLYFAVFQCVLAMTLRWLTNRWSVALIGVGLLLSTITAFFPVGGVMDFRIDFIAFNLFGIFICSVVRSGIFASRRWSLVVGGLAAFSALFRFITLVYLVGILGLVFLFLCLRLWRQRDPSARQKIVWRMSNLMIAGALMVACVGPAIWYNREVLQNYYIAGHVTGSEKEIRAQQLGIVGALDAVLFYPKSALRDHAGPTFLIMSALVLITTFGLSRVRSPASANPSASSALDIPLAYFFIIVCLLVPLAILTLDVAKSPVVGNILVPALLWLVLLSTLAFSRAQRIPGAAPVMIRALEVLAALALCSGMYTQLNMLSRRSDLSRQRPDVEQVVQLYDLIGQYSRELGWTAPRISADTIADYLYPTLMRPLLYERQGVLLDPQTKLGAIKLGLPAVDEAEAIALLQASDFAIITRSAPDTQSLYPFDRSTQALRPKLIAFCDQAFVPLREFHVFDRDVVLYMRPALHVEGDSAGWITSDGLTLSGSRAIFQARPWIELRGKSNFSYLSKRPNVSGQLLLPGQPPRLLQGTIDIAGQDYRILLDVPPEALPAQPVAQIRVLFDTYFVPKDIGLNSDTRRLVIRTPDSVTLLQQP